MSSEGHRDAWLKTGQLSSQPLAFDGPPSDLFNRSLLVAALFYAVSIAYERIIDVEVFKPYRVIGIFLALFSLLSGRIRIEQVGRIGVLFVLAGIVPGFVVFFGDSSYRRDDMFWSTVFISVFNIFTYLALVSVARTRKDVLLIGLFHAMAMVSSIHDIALEAQAAQALARVNGSFTNAALTAVSILFMCLFLVSLFRSPLALRWTTRWLIILASICIALYSIYISSLSGSRSGTVSLLAGLLCYAFLVAGRWRVVWAILLAFPLLVLIFIGSGPFVELLSRFSDDNIFLKRLDENDDSTHRFYLWRAGLDAFFDTYGLGTGLSRYPELHHQYFAKYASLSDMRWLESDLTLHNDYVVALVEHGILGFVLMVGLFRALYLCANSIVEPSARAISISVLLAMAINGFSHVGLQSYNYWFYFALMIAWRDAEARELAAFAVWKGAQMSR